MGYSRHHKGYRCLQPTTGRVYISRHVNFDEHSFPFAKLLLADCRNSTALYRQWIEEVRLFDSPCPSSSNQTSELPPVPSSTERPSSTLSTPYPVLAPPVSQSVFAAPTCAVSPSHPPVTQPLATVPACAASASSSSQGLSLPSSTSATHSMQTRLRSGIVKLNPKYACLVEYSVPKEPTSIKAALAHSGWFQAMQDEMTALQQNQTWELVPPLPSMNVVGCKWVFKTKLTAAGSLERLKARLVAKGFHQEEGVDFTETFSPVIKHATIRTVLSVAVHSHWSIHQLDVKNAFLHGNLSETVFMTQPPGFIDLHHPDHVCLLRKSLYGLRQAPRAWFDRFSSFLLESGFFCSSADPSLFVKHDGPHTLLLLLYVDDIILTGSSPVLLANLIHSLSLQFHMKDLGGLHYFLGIEVKNVSQGLFLSQTKYALELLEKADMRDCKPMSTPMALRFVPLTTDHTPLANPLFYRSLVGGLQYLTITRPDIAYATNVLCQKLHQPTLGDLHQLKRVLRYVKGSLSLGLTLRSCNSLHLYGFSDADWAGCATTRRSTTGYCTFLGSNLISWSAKKQSTVSRSSTEAEYRALASATADLTWVSFVLRDIGISLSAPTPLFCDNKSAISLTTNPVLHARTKHIEVDFHFVREKVSAGSLRVCYVPSSAQLADVFTKSLSRLDHASLRLKLGLGLPPFPNLRGNVKTKEAELKKADLQTTELKTTRAELKEAKLETELKTTRAELKEAELMKEMKRREKGKELESSCPNVAVRNRYSVLDVTKGE